MDHALPRLHEGEGLAPESSVRPPTDYSADGDLEAGGTDDAHLLRALVGRVAQLEESVTDFNRRSAHRESVIDRLHEENTQHREGLRRVILAPVVSDLMRMHDALHREIDRARGESEDGLAALWDSFVDDLDQTLDRCGVERFSVEPGDAYQAGEHRPTGVVPTDDATRDNTVAAVVSAGFRDRDNGKVMRPAKARFYRYEPPTSNKDDS